MICDSKQQLHADKSPETPPTDGDFGKSPTVAELHISFKQNLTPIRLERSPQFCAEQAEKDERWTLKPKVLESKLNISSQIYLR